MYAVKRSASRPRNSVAMNRMMPTTAAKSRIAAIISPILPALMSAVNTRPIPPLRRERRGAGHLWRPAPGLPSSLGGPRLFDVVDRGLGVLSGDPVRHLLEDGVGAD